MAPPVDADRATTDITAADSPWAAVNLPAGIQAGDYLLMYVQTTNGRTVTATGWDLITQTGDGTVGAIDNFILLDRVADGSEGTTVSVVPQAGTSKGGVMVWRVTGARTSGTIRTFGTTFPANDNMDPPAVNTDGSVSSDVLAIVTGGLDGETQTFSVTPSGFGTQIGGNSGTAGAAPTNGIWSGATRQYTGVTSVDPSAWTNDAPQTADGGAAYTVLVHAPAGPGNEALAPWLTTL